nr:class I SAM-dependent methyltransferase [uncultured Friedmanniella sp.]
MTVTAAGLSPGWLALREPADAAARSTELVQELQPRLPSDRPWRVHDLGCGTGSMGRWLAPRLPGPQHWVLHDREVDLLAHASARTPAAAGDGSAVTVETRAGDLTRLGPLDLAGADLVTASALLDMLTADELERLVTACGDAGCPVLLTLSVVGRVTLVPPDPADEPVAAAFNAHQRRTAGGRRLLGPDAATAAAELFTRRGAKVLVRPSPWRLGAADRALVTAWFAGWTAAACEQRPELAAATRDYRRSRLAAASAGRLQVTVHHEDLLVLPAAGRKTNP